MLQSMILRYCIKEAICETKELIYVNNNICEAFINRIDHLEAYITKYSPIQTLRRLEKDYINMKLF